MMDDMGLSTGMLLVATTALQDPHFVDTVVLLLDVSEDGALGVVLNRPSPILVADVLGAWRDLVTGPEVLFRGGPVGVDGAIAIGRLRETDDPPVGWRPVAGPLGMVDLDTPTELVDGALAALRVFAGYAGWGAQQLEREIEEGSWYAVSGETGDAFHDDTESLWRDVMRRQPGMLAWHVNRPVDPEVN